MNDNNSNSLYQLSTPSPPKSEVDTNSLKNSMDKNKESLKVKLMLRRPISQLIDQGIMPPLKTPPAFHEQRQKLERAKTGDLLKSKIQRRPARQQLIQQHILEDSTADPSLQERQRQLKKARLQDDLNERLCHRPGPLELIKGNILKTDEPLAQAIKEGQLIFRNTSEGELRKHPGPMFFYEEDSGSDGALSPSQESPVSQDINQVSAPVLLSSPASLATTGTLSSISSPTGSIGSPPATIATPSLSIVPQTTTALLTSTAPTTIVSRPTHIKQEPGGGKARKKSKSKSQPKARTIKFHEYKGPPSAHKNNNNLNNNINNSISNSIMNLNSNSNSSSASTNNTAVNPEESTYDLLLQQQQLFLQWQLEWQHKYPQIILPATQKAVPSESLSSSPNIASTCSAASPISTLTNSNSTISAAPQSRQSSPPVTESGPGSPLVRTISKLEDLKVSDLKAELKKRNLPVSGPKPQLIERLKPFTEEVMQMSSMGVSNPSPPSFLDFSIATPGVPSVEQPVVHDDASVANTSSPPPMSPMDTDVLMESAEGPTDAKTVSEENLKQQHKRIQELQNELQRSQLQLQKQQSMLKQQQASPPASSAAQAQSSGSVGSNTTKMLQQHLQHKIQQQQHLHRQKLQQQQLQQQQQLLQQQKQIVQHQVPTVTEDVAKQIQQQQPQTLQIPIMSTSTGNISLASTPVSLTTTLAGQLLIPQNVLTTAHIPLVALTNANIVDNSAAVTATADLPNAKTVRANSLPNGLGQIRTDSLTFAPATAQMQRTTTDPQFVMARPPPAYDEATRQVNTVQSIDKATADELKKKISKSQAVDDVLEILIRNGELPASVVQEPATPTTPMIINKSSSEPPTFPTSPPPAQPATTTSCADPMTVKNEPDDTINSCLSSFLNAEPTNTEREPDNFDLQLELELEGLESMDLSNLDTRRVATPTQLDSNQSMDVDMEWLDSIISSPQHQQQPQQPQHHQVVTPPPSENDHDPMLSVTTQNPLDLFSVDMFSDTDFKSHADLGTQLSWDRLDFAA